MCVSKLVIVDEATLNSRVKRACVEKGAVKHVQGGMLLVGLDK